MKFFFFIFLSPWLLMAQVAGVSIGASSGRSDYSRAQNSRLSGTTSDTMAE